MRINSSINSTVQVSFSSHYVKPLAQCYITSVDLTLKIESKSQPSVLPALVSVC